MGGRNSYASTKRYQDKTYEKITLRVHIGERDIYKAAADAAGESVNIYIKKAIEQRMAREKGPDAETSEP